jgi:cytochrome c551/c552
MTIFNSKCILCHELDTKKVGPPLRNIVKDYTPEFILNMMANPLEMQKSDPIVKNLLKQFNNVPMPDQKISQQDALNILDYLRSIVK